MTGAELDRAVRTELASLHPGAARDVSRHLVMAGRLLDEDAEAAYAHASAARAKAARLPSVREAVGLAAYSTGRYAEALAELRTARRLTGSNEHLPVMADAERGLGRPERALALAQSEEVAQLDPAGQVEMLIVAAGARGDLGELDAAVVTLQVSALESTRREPWVARLRSAYADALERVGRTDEARVWLERAADVDETGETGAADRLAELDGLVVVDFEDDEDEDGTDEDGTDEDGVEDLDAVEVATADPVPVASPAAVDDDEFEDDDEADDEFEDVLLSDDEDDDEDDGRAPVAPVAPPVAASATSPLWLAPGQDSPVD